MKSLKLILITGGLLVGQLSFAGIKEGGGDENISFICHSPENVDSSLTVIGLGNPFSQDIELKIKVAQTELDTDAGVLGSGINKYFGEKYEIEFFNDNTAMLIPLSDDQALTHSEVLNCEL